jgi:hypothetical protein
MKVKKVDSAILEWVEKYQIVNSLRKPFEFDSHSFLLEPMSDWSQRIAIRKSAQIGFSESFGILKALFAAEIYEWNVIYTNPTGAFSDEFVTTKVDPIINNNPILSAKLGVSKLSVKQIKDRFIFFRGTFSSEGQDNEASSIKGISNTSDLNIYDERDRSNDSVIGQLSSRLENSNYGGEWSFSNPSYPGVGTDGLWEKSDQKHWTVKCEHCGHYQYTDWIKLNEEFGDQVLEHFLVDSDLGIFICGKCRKEISDTTRMRGEWVAKYPDREISGYWMSQLNYPKHTAKSLLIKETERSPDNFYNFVLGKPYKSAELSVDRRIILSNITSTVNKLNHIFIGIDNGVKKHYVIQDEESMFDLGITEDWNVIDDIFRKYGDKFIAVIDSAPYPQPALAMARKYPGQVFLAHYEEPKDKTHNIEWLKGKRKHEVNVHRTNMFDTIVDKMVNQRFPININEKKLGDFATHWSTMYRDHKMDKIGVLRTKWDSNNKEKDHYAHATLYSEVAKAKLKGFGGSEVSSFERQKGYDLNPAIEVDDNWTSALPSIETILQNETSEYV